MKVRIWMVVLVAMIFVAEASFAGADVSSTGVGLATATGVNKNINDNTNNNKNKNKNTNDNTNNNRNNNRNISNSEVNYSSTSAQNFADLPFVATTIMNAPSTYPVGACNPLFGEGLNAEFTLDEIRHYAEAGSFMEKKGGAWHGLFHSRNKPSTGVPFEGKHHEDSIKLINWDIKEGQVVLPGDKKLGNYFCEGDYGFGLDVPLSRCLLDAVEETNTDRVGACYYVRTDAQVSGIAYGGSAGGSGIPNPTTAVAGVASAVLGTSSSYANIAYDVRLWALNKGSARWPEKKPDPAPVVAPTPAPKPDCNVFSVVDIDRKKVRCLYDSENNARIHKERGDIQTQKFICKKENYNEIDLSLLIGARKDYRDVVANFEKGHELAPGQKFGDRPTGVRTNTSATATEVVWRAWYNLTAVEGELAGSGKAYDIKTAEAFAGRVFSKTKNLKLNKMPESINEIKLAPDFYIQGEHL